MPRTIATTKTESITRTLGQIAFEAACPDGDWNLVPAEDKLRWEAAAEAVIQAVENERHKNDMRSLIESSRHAKFERPCSMPAVPAYIPTLWKIGSDADRQPEWWQNQIVCGGVGARVDNTKVTGCPGGLFDHGAIMAHFLNPDGKRLENSLEEDTVEYYVWRTEVGKSDAVQVPVEMWSRFSNLAHVEDRCAEWLASKLWRKSDMKVEIYDISVARLDKESATVRRFSVEVSCVPEFQTEEMIRGQADILNEALSKIGV